jgi:iron complex transport system substrate-binding protein
MPDLAEHAGARCILAETGDRSPVIEFDALLNADPDAIAIIPCGFTIDETRRDLHLLTERDGWNDLTAVKNRRVAVLDGNAYFNRPGPRLVRSCELLASVVHRQDDHVPGGVDDWERIWLEETPEAGG